LADRRLVTVGLLWSRERLWQQLVAVEPVGREANWSVNCRADEGDTGRAIKGPATPLDNDRDRLTPVIAFCAPLPRLYP